MQLYKAKKKRFGGRRTPGDVDVDGHNAVASSDYGVGVVVVSAPVSAASHRKDSAGFRHLFV